MVEMIIDLLARHHAASLADHRPQDAFLAVTHVRDVLIPLKERKAKVALWSKAVQFLEDNESRVRAEIQQIEGEDYRVWRWLPPSMAYSPAKNLSLASNGPGAAAAAEDVAIDESASAASTSAGVAQRPKVRSDHTIDYNLILSIEIPNNLLDAKGLARTSIQHGEQWCQCAAAVSVDSVPQDPQHV